MSTTEKLSWKQKMENATAGNKLDNSPAIHIIRRNVIVWMVLTMTLGFYSLTIRHRLIRFDRGSSDQWYFYAASAFFIGIFFAWLANQSARNAEKKTLSNVLLLVDTISFSTYIIHSLRLTPSLRDLNGYPVDPARYLEWMSTCPVLILLIGEITKTPRVAAKALFYDYCLLITGFLSAITREPYSSIFGTLSMGCFFNVIEGFNEMFAAAIEGRSDCKLDKVSLGTAKTITVVAWWAFPITFFSVKYGVVSFNTGEQMYAIADIFAKVFLTLIVVNSTVEQAQNERVNALSTIAAQMEEELSNSDKLLQRMMPQEVLEQIKSGRATQAQEYESVTVFFSDITNFTVLSSQTSTKDMLATLNALWLEYDAIAKRWGVYKVETIGDAYLGVAGCPEKVPDHAARAINFAIDIMAMVRTFKTAMGSQIQIRIGLNSGPITAGVLGELNPHWCIVGDTVNTASRMESTSKPMMIHISESTHKLAVGSNQFNFSDPDILQVKGKGTMTTYWVNGRK